jgi:hypothetical protein
MTTPRNFALSIPQTDVRTRHIQIGKSTRPPTDVIARHIVHGFKREDITTTRIVHKRTGSERESVVINGKKNRNLSFLPAHDLDEYSLTAL